MTPLQPFLTFIAVALLVGCASTGPVPQGDGTFTIVKKSAAPGLGASVSTKLAVEREGREYCQSKDQSVTVVSENVVAAEPGRLGYTELRFFCAVPLAEKMGAVNEQCHLSMSDSALESIKGKIELERTYDSPVPFQIATNNAFPTEAEKAAIARWAALREDCIRLTLQATHSQPSANALQANVFQQIQEFRRWAEAKIGEMTVALYNQKMTYSEFAQRRYDIGHDANAAELAFKQSILEKDQQRALQLRQLAEQEYTNRLNAMANYLQAVNARTPLDVHVSGSISVTR